MTSPTWLLNAPFRRGGRDESGIDCLGVVLEALKALGVPEPLRPDPWRDIERQWRRNPSAIAYGRGFPGGWDRLDSIPRRPVQGDVALQRDGEYGIGIFLDGLFWSANPGSGVCRVRWERVRDSVTEVWRLTTLKPNQLDEEPCD